MLVQTTPTKPQEFQMRMLKIVCHTDWKCRPWTSITQLGESENPADLVALMDADVLVWQEADVQSDLEFDQDASLLWEIEDRRWEMQKSEDPGQSDAVRSFAILSDEDRSTIAYHLLP